jgi:type IV secretory pathway TraG/TraD family ATPase VirD4
MKRRVLDLEKQEGESDLVQYFKNEVLGEHADKYSQFAMGLRMQLEDLSGNKLLSRVLCGQSDIDMDRHLSDGGVLLVNTAMGRLGKLGDTFGQFVVMHLQYAVFRRPGNEFTRIPHYLYIDEFPRYLNPYFNILLEIGRSYRCAVTVALQNTNQLDLDRAGDYRHTVLNGIRNIVVFGGLKADDAKRFEEEFGSVEVEERTASYDYRFLIPHLYPENYRVQSKHKPRFERVKIKELPQFHCIYRIVRDGQELPPGLGWCPFPKELRGINPEMLYDSEPLPKEPSAAVDGEISDSDQDQPTREDFWDID